jgi:hypothetical protein
MEGYCSTGQSPQRAVAPMEEEEEFIYLFIYYIFSDTVGHTKQCRLTG